MKQFVLGIDISKATLDVCIKPGGEAMKVDNNQAGFKNLYQLLKKAAIAIEQVLVVMEHTGSYSYRLENFLRSKSIDYCKVPALQIKRSMGIIRGKNDKIDAARIAEWGWLRREDLKPDEPGFKQLEKLKNLLSLRSQLVKDRSGYLCRLTEVKESFDLKKTDALVGVNERVIELLTSQITRVEQAIREVIDQDEKLKQVSSLIRSITGVGLIVAAFMICYTNNFKRIRTARKFNCYVGLAPFNYQSGTSIKGKTRVSHLANKQIKTILNLAAWSALRYDPELKKYYERRVREGMKKMSCVNIIRSKIVSRIFAVAKRETPFVPLAPAA